MKRTEDTNDKANLAQNEALESIEKQQSKIKIDLSARFSENLNTSLDVMNPIIEGYSASSQLKPNMNTIQNPNMEGQVDSTSDQDTVKIQVN